MSKLARFLVRGLQLKIKNQIYQFGGKWPGNYWCPPILTSYLINIIYEDISQRCIKGHAENLKTGDAENIFLRTCQAMPVGLIKVYLIN